MLTFNNVCNIQISELLAKLIKQSKPKVYEQDFDRISRWLSNSFMYSFPFFVVFVVVFFFCTNSRCFLKTLCMNVL